ncbi:MAG TPA: gephyrin-like molybdotransferase Glp [Candidatus Sulfotelmatobacter sp.]|nr:gephyrin-like molybdotransferase Glp [Candidatus Sulfotelmatobacter sp.]
MPRSLSNSTHCNLSRTFFYDLYMGVSPAHSIVLSFEDARRAVERQAAQVQAPAPEQVDLLSAVGRVLAEPVFADRDLPPFPRSARDGYALRAADLSRLPASLKVVGEIKAGARPEEIPSHIAPGQAASIMTGAPVPTGADAVVMVEHTTLRPSTRGDVVEIAGSVAAGANVVPRGAEARQGSQLLDRGLRLNDAAIALAATVGKSGLNVYQRPRVALLATGDELVEIGAAPGPTQIRNSNSYSLAVQVREAGGEPVLLPIAPDERQALRRLIEEGLQSDLLLITGGVSVGRYDLVEQVLSEMHAEFFFTGAQIQPGRPVVSGRCGSRGAGAPARETATEKPGTYFFGLPGNPVSTMVTFALFARPMLEALAGQSPRKLTFLHARLKSEIRVKPGLRRFLPAIISGEFDNAEVERVAWQGSGDIAATALANCYVVIPPAREHIAAGEWVAVMPR